MADDEGTEESRALRDAVVNGDVDAARAALDKAAETKAATKEVRRWHRMRAACWPRTRVRDS
jgi:hypothetical protein